MPLPKENYDTAPGLRRSDLWTIHKSPAHFKERMDNPTEPTPSLLFGIACHMAILEPNRFITTYRIIPEINKRTKEGKKAWAEFCEECERNSQIPISRADYDTILAMKTNLSNDPLASLFLNGKHETEWYWDDPITGIPLKCKCDIITDYQGKKYIVDYKTTDSCEDGHFERNVNKYGYQFQAGFYTSGLKEVTGENYGFAFLSQEKKPPYACRVYLCSDMFIEKGKEIFRNLVNRYHLCKTTDNWFGYAGQTPTPVILMDYEEKKQYNQGKTPTSASGFRSDDYLQYNDFEESAEDPYDDL